MFQMVYGLVQPPTSFEFLVATLMNKLDFFYDCIMGNRHLFEQRCVLFAVKAYTNGVETYKMI